MNRDGVFISYSKKDLLWLNKIKVPLRFLEINYSFNIWDDTKIKVSKDWNKEIEDSIKRCKVAIMLVSNNFLATEFILKKEIPDLLVGAEREGARIFNIILDHNVFKMTELSRYQSLNNPETPLSHLSEEEQQKLLVRLAEEVKETLDCKVRPKNRQALPDFCQLAVVLSRIAESPDGKTISNIEDTVKMSRRDIVNCIDRLMTEGLIDKQYGTAPDQNKKPSTLWKATIEGIEARQNLFGNLR
jgi:hypothetical protein